MLRQRSMVWAVLLVAAVFIAVMPFVSVWRAGGQVLNELPDINGHTQTNERVGLLAMFDSEFILARQTVEGADEMTVAGALTTDGFELSSATFTKECCGDYDAVVATISNLESAGVLIELTAADSDWQVMWPAVSGFGTFLALASAGKLLMSRASERKREPAIA